MVSKTLKMVDDQAVDIGVDNTQRAEIAKQLGIFLASTYTLYMKSLYYHWNVTGSNFHELHQLFGNHYEDLHAAGDLIAERIRALGHFTPGTYAEFSRLSAIQEDGSLPRGGGSMIENLLKDNECCSKEARKVLDIAEAAGDEVTVDMMVGRMAAHEKAAWMLRSTIE